MQPPEDTRVERKKGIRLSSELKPVLKSSGSWQACSQGQVSKRFRFAEAKPFGAQTDADQLEKPGKRNSGRDVRMRFYPVTGILRNPHTGNGQAAIRKREAGNGPTAPDQALTGRFPGICKRGAGHNNRNLAPEGNYGSRKVRGGSFVKKGSPLCF